jgi:hypothetical protein
MEWFEGNLRGELKPEFIIWTGDSAPHSLIDMTEDLLLETVERLTKLINDTFPDVPLLVSLGNHDFEPANY